MCYAVPTVGAIITSVAWSRTKNIKLWWLNLLLYGCSIFGFVDHFWNGELFAVSDNIARDLLLGVAITFAIFCIWAVMLIMSKFSTILNAYTSAKTS